MSPLWSLYDHTFHINIICPQGITYNPCPEGCHLQIHNFWTFQPCWTKWLSSSKTYFLSGNQLRWKMPISKFWLDVLGEMVGIEGMLVAFQSLLTIKKVLVIPIFNRMNPFRSFYDSSFDTKFPGKNKKINNTLLQHRSLLRQCYCAVYETLYFSRA
jgi:hypothetical protein